MQDTLILETDFETGDGGVTVVDFMPVREKNPHLVRIVRGRRGEVAMDIELSLRFDYGELVPWITRLEDGRLQEWRDLTGGALRSSVALRGENLKTVSQFTVKAGESVSFVLGHGPSHLPAPDVIDAEKAYLETVEFWKEWTSGCKYRGPYAEAVKRSLIR